MTTAAAAVAKNKKDGLIEKVLLFFERITKFPDRVNGFCELLVGCIIIISLHRHQNMSLFASTWTKLPLRLRGGTPVAGALL